MRSPKQPLSQRRLALRVELLSVAVAAGGVLGAFLLGWLMGPLSPEVGLEGRVGWVVPLASVGPIAGWILANESETRVRYLPAALLVVPLAHAITPSSALLATLDVGLLILAMVFVASRAFFRIGTRRHESAPGRRLGSAALLGLAVPGPLFTLAWGLASSIAVPGVIRLFHQAPVRLEGERPIELTTADGLTLRGAYTPGDDGAPGIVLIHGYGDSRGRMQGWAELLHARGAHVLRFDHRAAGVSDGVVCTLADREPDDVARAVHFLEAQPGVGPVSALGTSMGGGALLAALPSLPTLRSFVAIAPASDFAPIVLSRLPPEPIASAARTLIWGVPRALGYHSPLALHPRSGLDGSAVPGTIVHSRTDRTIPPALTEALAEAHPDLEVLWLESTPHNEGPRVARETPAVRARILARLGLPEAGAEP